MFNKEILKKYYFFLFFNTNTMINEEAFNSQKNAEFLQKIIDNIDIIKLKLLDKIYRFEFNEKNVYEFFEILEEKILGMFEYKDVFNNVSKQHGLNEILNNQLKEVRDELYYRYKSTEKNEKLLKLFINVLKISFHHLLEKTNYLSQKKTRYINFTKSFRNIFLKDVSETSIDNLEKINTNIRVSFDY
jgi:hypothetical protein